MSLRKWNATTKRDLIIEVWEHLDCESVGAHELEQIQQALRERFGEGSVQSPAAIARTVADEGAVLRHPEVFDCDLKWRQQEITTVLPLNDVNFETLKDAETTIRKLDAARRRLQDDGNKAGLRRVRELALRWKQDAQSVAGSGVVEDQKKLESREIAQWLTIWLQEPDLFEDWLSLRRRSQEFLQLLHK
ncbi:MAG: hypothetical protein M3539_03305 [Acidobacteriota bacterium]|nr:hypothetical protein [Acidobacteriota bacterium]